MVVEDILIFGVGDWPPEPGFWGCMAFGGALTLVASGTDGKVVTWTCTEAERKRSK